MKTVLSAILLLSCCFCSWSQYKFHNASLLNPDEHLFLWGEHNELYLAGQAPGDVVTIKALHSQVNQSREPQVVNGQFWITPTTQQYTQDTLFLYKSGELVQKQAFRIDTNVRSIALKWGAVAERGNSSLSIKDIDPKQMFELYYPGSQKKSDYFVTEAHIVVTDSKGFVTLDTNLSRWDDRGKFLKVENAWASNLKVGDHVRIDKVKFLRPHSAQRARRCSFEIDITE